MSFQVMCLFFKRFSTDCLSSVSIVNVDLILNKCVLILVRFSVKHFSVLDFSKGAKLIARMVKLNFLPFYSISFSYVKSL